MIDQAWQPRLTEGMVRCYRGIALPTTSLLRTYLGRGFSNTTRGSRFSRFKHARIQRVPWPLREGKMLDSSANLDTLIDELRGSSTNYREFAQRIALACAVLADRATRANPPRDPGAAIRGVFRLGE